MIAAVRGLLARGWPAVAASRVVPLALAVLGLVLAVVAQSWIQPPQLLPRAAVVLVAGLALTAVALALAPPGRAEVQPAATHEGSVRRLPLALAVGLVSLTWLETADGVYTAANVVAWVGALVAWCWAWWPRETNTHRPARRLRRLGTQHGAWLVLLAAIVALGAFYRFHDLAGVPSDPTSDHAEKLLDVHDVDEGARPIFFPRNTGREPLQFYFTYGLMKVFGLSLSFETLKVGTALIGLLAVPAVFLLAREVAGRTAGLFAAVLFAVSTWPVATARAGLRFPYAQLFSALALWLLLRYLRRGDRRDALACGLVIGAGLHGYTPFRIVPLLVPVFVGLAFLFTNPSQRAGWRARAGGGGLILATAFVACAPLARYAVDHPGLVFLRARSRVESGLPWTDALATFIDNNGNALLAFNWRGDRGSVNAVSFAPFLDVMTGGAFLAGLVIAGYQLGVRRSFPWAALLASIPILMLPSTTSIAFPNENPAVNRMGPVAPVVFTIAALPFAYLWGGARRGRRSRLLTAGVLLVALAFVGNAARLNFVSYFGDFARQYRRFVPNTHEIGAAMKARRKTGLGLDGMYALGYPGWVDGRNVGFELGDAGWYADHNIEPVDALPRRRNGRPLLFVLHPADALRRRELTAQFAGGTFTVLHGAVHDFVLYSVPAREAS